MGDIEYGAIPDNKSKMDDMDLDNVLPYIGEFGRYQKLLIWLVCLPSCIPCGFSAFNQLFMSDVPDHWCKVNELSVMNITLEERKEISIPLAINSNNTFEQCYRYAIPWQDIINHTHMLSIIGNNTWNIEGCIDGWEYEKTTINSSIVIDFDLVCDRAIYPTLGLVALNVGGPIGVYCFGILNDKIGRRKSFFLCLTTLLIGSFLTAMANSYYVWVIARSIVGLTIPAMYQIPFIIALELVGPSYRSFVTAITCMAYTFGLILLSGVAFYVREWRMLTLLTSAPFLLFYFFWFVLPESPRWLLLQERLEEAYEIIETIARVNRKTVPEDFTTNLKKHVTENALNKSEKKSLSVFALCQTPNLRLKTILITLNWCASEMVYVGLSYYGPAIGDNQYISFFLSSAVEIPSYIVSWLVMDKWGRRLPLCLSMVLSGLFCVVTVLLPNGATTLTLIMFLFSKLFISASFLIIYPYAGELYPTELRGVGIGTSAYVGGIGLIVIPFINYLGSEVLVLPLAVMGVVSILGGLTCLRLPETLHCRLPQTAQEGEEFGKDWECNTCWRRETTPAFSDELETLELKDTIVNDGKVEIDGLSRRSSMRRLVRQPTLETQKRLDGTISMTYWF